MFGAFFAQYFYNRILSDGWPTRAGLPPGFERVPAFPLPVILTVVLVASGFTAHFAQNAIRRDDRDAFQGWLIVTILLGAGFLGGQAYEYTNLIVVDGFIDHLGHLRQRLLQPDRAARPARHASACWC